MTLVPEAVRREVFPDIANQELLRSLQTMKAGIAIASPDDWTICFENAQFFK
jgi:hypothetical protein